MNIVTWRAWTNGFFLNAEVLQKHRRLLPLSTVGCVTLILCGVFFVAPVFAEESLAVAQTTSDSNLPNSTPSVSNPPVSTPAVSIAAPGVTASLIKVTGGLLLVIAAIFASAWFFRRFTQFSPISNDSLKVIGGLSMGQKERLVLLQVGDEQVLIGVAPGNIQKLHILKTPIELDNLAGKSANTFSEQLGEALSKWKSK